MKLNVLVPGKSFSGSFLLSWTGLQQELLKRGWDVELRNFYSGDIYHGRTRLLMNDDTLRHEVKGFMPFGGAAYDYMLWIDSDMVFVPGDFFKLLDVGKQIVSGLALIDAGRANCGRFTEAGEAPMFAREELPKENVFRVDYCGLAFLLVKHGVFERMTYPWFKPMAYAREGVMHFPCEDVAWCLEAGRLGFKIFVASEARIGHEKGAILRP